MSSRNRWTLWGMGFGVCFPVMAWAIRVAQVGQQAALELAGRDPLLWIIATAPIFLGLFARLGGVQNDKVRAFSEHLEQLVAERTAELAAAMVQIERQAVQRAELLDALSEGIVTVSEDGQLSAERSQALTALLPESAGVTTLQSLLELSCGTPPDTTELVLSLLWDRDGFDSPFEATCGMLGRRLIRNPGPHEQILEFQYRRLGSGAVPDALLLIVRDRTAQIHVEEQQAEQAERIERIAHCAADTVAWEHFRQEAEALWQKLGQPPQALDPGVLHTLKGNLGLFGFHGVAQQLHGVEDALAESEPLSRQWELLNKARADFERQVKDVLELLDLRSERGKIAVDRERLGAVFEAAFKLKDPRLLAALAMMQRYPLTDCLGRYVRRARERAKRRGQDLEVECAADAELSFEELGQLDCVLVHLFNNAVAHGLRGLTRPLHLKISVKRRRERLSLIFEDDGAGIDAEALSTRAVDSGYWTAEQAQSSSFEAKRELVFASGVSSATEVSDLAGRGQGLAHARRELQEQGGQLRVEMPPSGGTRFVAEIPADAATRALALAAPSAPANQNSARTA